MTKGELLNFAMQVLIDHDLRDNGYAIVSATDNTDAIANIIAKKDGCYYLIAVIGYCDYEEPILSIERKLSLRSLGDIFNAQCYYAPVGFRSSTDLLMRNGNGVWPGFFQIVFIKYKIQMAFPHLA